VTVRTRALDAEEQWLLLVATPKDETVTFATKEYSRLFQVLLELSSIVEVTDMVQSLEKALVAIQSLLQASHLCIYQAESGFPKLNKIVSIEPDDVFPEKISSADLIRLSNPMVWKPGKRVTTEIHKSGRLATFNYVASTPLGQDGALFGLLVIGDTGHQPPETPDDLLLFLGNIISSSVQKHILVANLQKENAHHQALLAVRNSLMENAEEGILVLNPDLAIKEINPSAELMLGYGDWEARGQTAENVLIGAEGLSAALLAACRGIPTPNLGNVSLNRRNGQAFPVHIQIVPVQKDEKLLAVLVFITDISEDEKVRLHTQQLEHRAVLGEFTAIFAHEVRNPINNISTGIQLMSSRMPAEDSNQDVINRILSDCGRLDHLMESILSYSRQSESGFKGVDMAQLLQKLLSRWHPRLGRASITPYFQIMPDTPKVKGDSRSLEQVFTNLISNAVEAMSKTGGTLAIKVGPSDAITNRPQVEITVSDSGSGIPDEVRVRLFEPFVTTNPRGNGLGLAITKQIVNAHQGTINVESFPGGTMFKVLLPAASGED
jgi:PAS domain S-box-containing protein